MASKKKPKLATEPRRHHTKKQVTSHVRPAHWVYYVHLRANQEFLESITAGRMLVRDAGGTKGTARLFQSARYFRIWRCTNIALALHIHNELLELVRIKRGVEFDLRLQRMLE